MGATCRSGEYGGCGKTVTFSDLSNCLTILDACANHAIDKHLTSCHWMSFLVVVLSFSSTTSR